MYAAVGDQSGLMGDQTVRYIRSHDYWWPRERDGSGNFPLSTLTIREISGDLNSNCGGILGNTSM